MCICICIYIYAETMFGDTCSGYSLLVLWTTADLGEDDREALVLAKAKAAGFGIEEVAAEPGGRDVLPGGTKHATSLNNNNKNNNNNNNNNNSNM